MNKHTIITFGRSDSLGEDSIQIPQIKNDFIFEKNQKNESLNNINSPVLTPSIQELSHIIQFTEILLKKLSYKDVQKDVFNYILKTFREDSVYSSTILLQSDDKEFLRIYGTTENTNKIKKVEKKLSSIKKYKIYINKSKTFQQVIKDDQTLILPSKTILLELLPKPVAKNIIKLLGYDKKNQTIILTPLKKFDEIIGAIAIGSSNFDHHFKLPVKHLVHHISNTLEKSEIYHRRKKQKRQLLAYKLAVENAQEMIIAVNTHYECILANKLFISYHQLQEKKVFGLHIKKIIGSDSFQQIKPYLKDCFQGKRSIFRFTKTFKIKGERQLNVIFYPLQDKENNIIGAAGIVSDITERQQTKKRLEKTYNDLKKSIEERDLLLEEIHHRVKNNLQIIISLIDLQREEHNKKNPTHFFEELKNRIYLMSILHEQLYQSSDFKHVLLGDYITNITKNLENCLPLHKTEITILVNHEQEIIDFKKAISCGLIINELVSNAIKHAFTDQEKGIIQINISSSKTHHIISIQDNGKGFPKNIDFYHSTSLGLQLIHMLVNQLKGQIRMKNEGGSTVIVRFPKK